MKRVHQHTRVDPDDDRDVCEPVTPDGAQIPWWCSCRLGLAGIGFLGFVNLYALRVNLSVAMVCMINQTALLSDAGDVAPPGEWAHNSTAIPLAAAEQQCRVQPSHNTTSKEGEFTWSKETQGIILGSFFWGYLLTQIPGGWLAQRIGGKRVFGFFMLATALATLLIPVGARGSPYLLMALRVVQGIGQGVAFPAMHAIWSKWAPPLERSKLTGFTYAGAQIGNVLALPVSGLLCDYGFDGGWPSIFYIFGSFCVVWFILWMALAYDSPDQHPRISEAERKYIMASIGASEEKAKRHHSNPWGQIFRSPAVWAIIVGHTCANWGTYTLLTNIPTYMREVLKFDVKSNGLFSAVPYIAYWMAITLGAFVADSLRTKGVPTKVVRKIMFSLGTLLPGLLLIGTGYVSCQNPYAAVAILTLATGCSGFQYPGFVVNHVDIAPPFAGVLFGISNTFATIPGIFAPYVIGRITTEQTQGQWQLVFYISAAIYALGAVFFCVFADGEVQDWVRPYMFDEEDQGEKNITVTVTDITSAKTKVGGTDKEGTKEKTRNAVTSSTRV